MPIRVVTAPTVLPLTLGKALRHVRALQDDADMVAEYVQAAVEAVEDYTARAMITRTLCLDLAAWPSFCRNTLRTVELRRSPLIAISSVKYYINDVLTTWDPTNYRADVASTPGRLVLKDTADVPALDIRQDAVQITFTAGYGTKAKNVPGRLKVAVLQLARHWYDNKSSVGDRSVMELPLSTRHLLRSLRVDALAPL